MRVIKRLPRRDEWWALLQILSVHNFFIIKKGVNFLLQICYINMRREYSRDIAEVIVNPTFCCPLVVLLICLSIFKTFMFRTTILRPFMLHPCRVVSQLCQAMAAARVVVICHQFSDCNLKSLGPVPELFYPLLTIIIFWCLVKQILKYFIETACLNFFMPGIGVLFWDDILS